MWHPSKILTQRFCNVLYLTTSKVPLEEQPNQRYSQCASLMRTVLRQQVKTVMSQFVLCPTPVVKKASKTCTFDNCKTVFMFISILVFCVLQITSSMWRLKYNLSCQPVDYSDNPDELRV